MPNIYVLMGAQGAGKGTQAQMLAGRFGLPIVATGDVLRLIASQETDLGRHIKEVLAEGNLVDDEILVTIVKDRLCQNDCRPGSILDGYPRTLVQARLLEKIAQDCGHRIVVIHIDVPLELLLRRLTGRRICPVCNTIYHVEFKPPRVEDHCDLEGALLLKRLDDTEEAIQHRLQLYYEKTKPLTDYYSESNRLYRIDGTGTPENVASRIADVINKESAISQEAQAASEHCTLSEVS